jgi:sugar phosphate isomerase/epimerase
MNLTRIVPLVAALALHWISQAEPIPNDYRVGGFAIGCQAYSFNRFTVFEAIEKTEQTGSKTIEFYPGQALSPDRRTVKWDHNADDALIGDVQAKLKKHGIRAVNYGVVGIPNDETAARKIFDFARKMGMYGVTTESLDSLDVAEKLAKEYDLRVCIHEHAKRMKKDANGQSVEDTSYKVWNPAYVAEIVKNRDRRIGACADIGHWQTSGIRAIDGLKMLRGRVLSLHMKDRAGLGHGQHDAIFGTGQADISGVLAELKAQGFDGNISIEYEYNWDNSVPDIAQCVGFVRGWATNHR